MRIANYVLCLGLAGGLALPGAGRAEDPIEAGPLWHQFRLTLAPGMRTEVLGPLISYEQRGTAETWRWTPLVSYGRDAAADRSELDVFYPVISYDRFGGEYRFQLLQWLSFAGGESLSGEVKRRVTLFPLYFQQRSSDPASDYTALFPLYGTLRNRIFRDEIHFLLWPGYVRTRKRDVVTDNFLVPLVHWRQGEGVRGWQVWPLAGYETKQATTRTNSFGETETVAGHRKLFALWPFFFHYDLGLGTDNPQTQRILLPFYSGTHSPLRDSATYLWPFGLTLTEDREKGFHEIGAPWPLVVFARGEGKHGNRVWPFFSEVRSPSLASSFYLWPLYKHNRAMAPALDRTRTRILFFLYSDLTEKNTETGAALRRTDLWPLFTARRDLEGKERFQLVAPLEPLLPNNKSIERNYSPVWSVWRTEKNPKSRAASESLLWNLYRAEAAGRTKKCSFLFGLVHYESGPRGSRWRLFHAPKRPANEGPASAGEDAEADSVK
jgi:hypothetical protein